MILSNVFLVVGALIAVFMMIAIVRAIIGPTIPDRVVALDTINTFVVLSMVLLGVAFSEVIYIDVAIVYALLSFIGTVYIAKYLEGGSWN